MPSTALATPDSNEPGQYLALNRPLDELEQILADNIGDEEVSEFDLPRIKVPSGGGSIWQVPKAGGGVQGVDTLEGIIVAFKRTRAYWDPNAPKGSLPQCKSNNAVVGVGDPGGSCKTCPHAQFGTATNDRGEPAAGQACNSKEIWFMLRTDSFLPTAIALPATSMKAAKAYRISQLGSVGMSFAGVVTSIKLEQGTSGDGIDYSRIVPTIGRVLTAEEAAAAQAYAARFRPLFDQAAEAMASSNGDGFDVRDADVVPEAA